VAVVIGAHMDHLGQSGDRTYPGADDNASGVAALLEITRAFARKARPFVRFFGNYFDGYHEPVDTVEKLDPAQVLKMARLAFASAWLFADR